VPGGSENTLAMVAPVFTSPISPKCSQSSSEASRFFLASAMTSSLVFPEGSETTTISWVIGTLSRLVNATSIGPDLTESGIPLYLNFCTETLYVVSPLPELDDAAAEVVWPLAHPVSASPTASAHTKTSARRPTCALQSMTTSSPDDGTLGDPIRAE
jgi:hypothetical protein